MSTLRNLAVGPHRHRNSCFRQCFGDGADQVGLVDGLAGRQLPHQERRALRRRSQKGDQRRGGDHGQAAGGQLGFKGPEHLRAVRDGLVPMADVLNIQQIGDEPVLGTEGIAFLVGSADELKVLHKHLRPVYEQVAARNNQKIIYMVPWPTQYLHLKVKVDTLDGLKGIKIRVPDKGAADMLTAVGMAPVLIPWGETIPALASGAVSGVSTSAVSGVDGKFWGSSSTAIRRTMCGRADRDCQPRCLEEGQARGTEGDRGAGQARARILGRIAESGH